MSQSRPGSAPAGPAILGQDRALDILRSALASGRMHHAWIFAGPRGVGKFTTAVEIARILLDPGQEGIRHQASGTSAYCLMPNASSPVQRLIDTNTHPDLHIIRKELALYSDNPKLREKKLKNIPIDLLRERILGGLSGDTNHEAAAYRTAALGHGKVFIIDEAELMAWEGQSAMLKTLEEPPAQTYFFLITSNPNRLFPTIRSRCQIVHFGRLSRREMEEWWKETSKRQNVETSKQQRESSDSDVSTFRRFDVSGVEWVLDFAEGAPGAALLALEYGFFEWQKSIDPMLREMDAGRFPAAMGERLGAMVEEFAQAWVKRHGKEHTSKDAANKDGARHVLSLLSAHARKRLAASVDDEDTAERWGNVVDALRECERQIEFNVNQKLALDNLVAQWNLALNGEPV